MATPLIKRDDGLLGEHEAALGPPRFSLRTLLGVVTALGCLFGAMAAVGAMWSLAILLLAVLVLAHVLGNSLGTQLRDRATRRAPDDDRPAAAALVGPLPTEIAAPLRLRERSGLHRATRAVAVAGAFAGALAGGVLSAGIYPEAGTTAVALGVVSFAVLGALVGFVASSFVSVARSAMREALADPAARRTSRQAGR